MMQRLNLGFWCQVSAPPPAKQTAGQIEKKTFERRTHRRRTVSIERPIWMTLRFFAFLDQKNKVSGWPVTTLKQKGLVSESVINNVKQFTAAQPNRLLDFINSKRKELSQEESLVKSLIPSLENLSKGTKSKIKTLTYIGMEGMKTAIDEVISSMKKGDEICAMSISHRKDKKFNDFWINFNHKRIAKKINLRPIFSEKDLE